MDASVERAMAAALIAARANRLRLSSLAERAPGFDQRAAYRVARRVRDAFTAAGHALAGRKIGFTNRTIWAEYGVYEPIWAHLYDSTVCYAATGTASHSLAAFVEPRLEPEIILHFGATPPARATPEQLVAAIDWIAHGYEIVDSPFPGWRFTVADTIAAFGLHGALVIGPQVPIAHFGATAAAIIARLAQCRITLDRDGVEQDRGVGANVLDGPIAACAHLSAVLAAQPDFAPLAAGEVVTTGTLTRAWPIGAGERWSTELHGVPIDGFSIGFT